MQQGGLVAALLFFTAQWYFMHPQPLRLLLSRLFLS